MNQQDILKTIEQASGVIGKTWPLYSFVTSNPLAGYEHTDFLEAVGKAYKKLGAQGLPDARAFKRAFEKGEIDKGIFTELLREHGKEESPESYLKQLLAQEGKQVENADHELDRISLKWLSSFLDEGLADWQMPFKSKGFYNSWRKLAVYDRDFKSSESIPKTAEEAVKSVLEPYDAGECYAIIEHHLAALPGWTGYIKYRMDSQSVWQQKYPISLMEYLGVRLWIARQMDVAIKPEIDPAETTDALLDLKYIWLEGWEKTWQNNFFGDLSESAAQQDQRETERPDAQFVFCIDTRSELVRRHLESQGNYETFGYAGFFGIPMDYQNPDDNLVNKSCPPIVPSGYKVSETPAEGQEKATTHYQESNWRIIFYNYFLKRMKNLLPSAFGFVETSGFFYGFSLLLRTLRPAYANSLKLKNEEVRETVYDPKIEHNSPGETESSEISLAEKTALVKSAFDLCGWRHFARLVVFTGHESHSSNNPFASSLDCGACAGNSGKHNARMLAKLANEKAVRKALCEEHDIHIPEDTFFMGGQHVTTTDEVELFDSAVPQAYEKELQAVKQDLKNLKESVTQERLNADKESVAEAWTKANNWAETRPEWGLAKNAGYVIGPRSLSKHKRFSDCFFSSYDWEMDDDGKLLEALAQGPLVVTQWINNHYYFASVDNDKFGAGSKITHNITGKFGVVQGNGSDLKMGLPLQSLKISDGENFHSPLRLTAVIQAPKARIRRVLENNPNVKRLIDNRWIHLFAMDPEENNRLEQYCKGVEW